MLIEAGNLEIGVPLVTVFAVRQWGRTEDHMRSARRLPRLTRAFAAVAATAMLALGACSGGAAPAPDGAMSPVDGAVAACSANVPAGEMCNMLADVSTPITTTCATGTMGTGAGGTIFDGTYVLTSQVFYNYPSCSPSSISGTILVSGSCVQAVTTTPLTVTASAMEVVNGKMITQTVNCLSLDRTSVTFDVPVKTFTATPTTFTTFHLNSPSGNSNPDRVEVYTKL